MKSRQIIFLLLLISALSAVSCKESSNPAGSEPFVFIPGPVIPTENIIMYEILVRNFSQAGTFSGIIPRLDTLKAMGINTVWLMPIHPVGQIKKNGTYGSPYAVKNYTAVNSEFGTLTDFKILVNECHKRDMALVIDWVANHTAWDNPWITAHKNWYTQDGAGNIIIPAGTNWADVADLNFSNADMRREMISSMKYWITNAGIDGFRCDAADMVPDDFWKQAIDSLKKVKNNLILLAEGANSSHFLSGFKLNYSWDFYGNLKNVFKNGYSATNLTSSDKNERSALPLDCFKLRFTTNHDETSWDAPPPSLFGGIPGAQAASAAMLAYGSVPLLYNGQETGISINQNIFEKSVIDWTKNRSMQTYYRQLLNFYKNSTAVKSGTIESFSTTHVLRIKRTTSAETVIFIVNVRNSTQPISFPAGLRSITWKNVLTDQNFSDFDGNLSPYGVLILRAD